GVELIRERFPTANVNPVPNPSTATPELHLIPNDRQITDVGWNRQSIGRVVQILGDGLWLGEHFDGERRLDILLKTAKVKDPEALVMMPVATPGAGVVTLGTLVEIKREVGASQIQRIDGRRTVTLVFNPPTGLSLEEALNILRSEIEPQIRALLPTDGAINYGGSANDLGRAVNPLLNNFLLAFFLLFMIMAALFRSLKDSFLVIISVPLATVGGVMALKILNLISFQPMDLLAMIGFVILLGLVVNNAILLVVQTRRSQLRGLALQDAIREALRLRLRPIFMSTLTSIFGMMPLLLFAGEGSVIYRGMAAVIVGGMSVSTVFTLLLLPSLLQIAGASHHDTEFRFWKMKKVKKVAPAE
ncbi:MAG: efflux RND transporter permease subunit, partial [Sphingomonadales bacterium]